MQNSVADIFEHTRHNTNTWPALCVDILYFYRAMLCIARTMPSQDVYLSVRLPVCPSVRPSQAGILSKWLNIYSIFFTIGSTNVMARPEAYPEIWITGEGEGGGVSSPPSLSFPSPQLRSRPLNPARGPGERCKLPQWGLGRSPIRNLIWYI